MLGLGSVSQGWGWGEQDDEFFLKGVNKSVLFGNDLRFTGKWQRESRVSGTLHPASPHVNTLHNHGTWTDTKTLTSVRC